MEHFVLVLITSSPTGLSHITNYTVVQANSYEAALDAVNDYDGISNADYWYLSRPVAVVVADS